MGEATIKFMLPIRSCRLCLIWVLHLKESKFYEYFETTINFYYKITLDIDSAKVSKIVIQDDYLNETSVIRSPIGNIDYNKLLSILALQDISRFPEEYYWADHENDVKCCNSIFELRYNGQIKKSRGCTYMPFNYLKLENFLWDYIGMKAGTVGGAPTIRL